MFRRLVIAGAVALALALPGVAWGSGGWEWPVPGSVALGYGQPYADAGGRACTHGGLDISAAAGTTVRACTGGEVTFAGLVPGGVGVRVWAVTVLTDDGLKFTVMPLSSATVRAHDRVSAGDGIGPLAAIGDASGAGAHVHLSLKRGSASLDPLGFLAQPAAPAAPAAPNVPSGGSAAGGASAGSGTHAPVSSTVHAPVHIPVHAPVHAPSAAPQAGVVPWVSHAPALTADPAAGPASVLHGALRSLTKAPPLMRVEQVASPAVLDPDRAGADLSRARGQLVRLASLVLAVLLAIGCVWAVMRSARKAGRAAVPAEALRAHE